MGETEIYQETIDITEGTPVIPVFIQHSAIALT